MRGRGGKASPTWIILNISWRERWTIGVFMLGMIAAGAMGWNDPHRSPAVAVLGGPPLTLIGGEVRAGAPWIWLLQYGLFVLAMSPLVGTTGSSAWVALQRVRGISPVQWAVGQWMAGGVFAFLWTLVMSIVSTSMAAVRGMPIMDPVAILPALALALGGLWATMAPMVASQRLLGDERLGLLILGLFVIMASMGSPLIYWTPFGYALADMMPRVPITLSFLCMMVWTSLWWMLFQYAGVGAVW